jgi:RNA polymerase sigma-70 factor, ECF subfamily
LFPPNMLRLFQKLVEQHRHRVYTFAFYYLRDREEAEDVTQDVLLKLWQHLPELEADRLVAWLLRVTRNACHDAFRRNRTYRGMVQDDADGSIQLRAEHSDPDPEELAEASDAKRKIELALKDIADPYRTIVILREIQEMSYEQISEILQMPLNTIKVYLHRGRRMLREQLQEVVAP